MHCDTVGAQEDNFGSQCGPGVREKPRFTHARANLRGDVSRKRFSTHVGEGRKRGWRSARAVERWDRKHRHGTLLQGTVTGHCHSSTPQWHINKDTPDDFSSGVSEERQLPTLPPGLAVPSAMTGLASLFGMGRGGSPSL